MTLNFIRRRKGLALTRRLLFHTLPWLPINSLVLRQVAVVTIFTKLTAGSSPEVAFISVYRTGQLLNTGVGCCSSCWNPIGQDYCCSCRCCCRSAFRTEIYKTILTIRTEMFILEWGSFYLECTIIDLKQPSIHVYKTIKYQCRN